MMGVALGSCVGDEVAVGVGVSGFCVGGIVAVVFSVTVGEGVPGAAVMNNSRVGTGVIDKTSVAISSAGSASAVGEIDCGASGWQATSKAHRPHTSAATRIDFRIIAIVLGFRILRFSRFTAG